MQNNVSEHLRAIVDDELLPYITFLPEWAAGIFADLMTEAIWWGDEYMMENLRHHLRIRTSINGRRSEQLTQGIVLGSAPIQDPYAKIRPKYAEAPKDPIGSSVQVFVNGNATHRPSVWQRAKSKLKGGGGL